MEHAPDKDSLILDFFVGSGTTGHAVWDLNKEDGGNRKFILVQLDEEVQDEEIKKEFPTVADICIERLRRVSEKYKKEGGNLFQNNQDFGFKVFKLDKSNFNLKDEFQFDPSEDREELKKKYLEWLGMWTDQPLVSDWKEIELSKSLNLEKIYQIIDIAKNLDTTKNLIKYPNVTLFDVGEFLTVLLKIAYSNKKIALELSKSSILSWAGFYSGG